MIKIMITIIIIIIISLSVNFFGYIFLLDLPTYAFNVFLIFYFIFLPLK